MLYRGPSSSQPNSSTDGLTFYKHAGSICARSRSRPVTTRSPAQVQVRNLIPQLSIFWENPLTNAQRMAWGAYAFNTPLLDAYNNARFVKGYAHFMRSNRPRLQFGLPYIADAPTAAGLPTITTPTCTWDPGTGTLTINFNPTDAWAHNSQSALLLWLSRPQPRSRTRPPEIYQPLIGIAGAPGGITSPVHLMVDLSPHDQLTTRFIRSAATYADGSYSATVYPTPDTNKKPPPPPAPAPAPPDCNDAASVAHVSGTTWTADRHGAPVTGALMFPANCPWIGPCFWQVLAGSRWLTNVATVGGVGNPTARVHTEDTLGAPTGEWTTYSSTWWNAAYHATGAEQPATVFVTVTP